MSVELRQHYFLASFAIPVALMLFSERCMIFLLSIFSPPLCTKCWPSLRYFDSDSMGIGGFHIGHAGVIVRKFFRSEGAICGP